jgi:thiamine biosynthesis protein ThiI
MAKKALLLLSGGIDSPVAGHLASRQGLDVLAVHFSLEPITDDTAAVKSRKLAERLGLSRLFVVTVGPAFAEIAERCEKKLYFVLSKRLMVRIAEAIARREGCDYLLTGESLGQVSSQTLQNLRAIDAAASMVVLRPLIGFDKEETIRIARQIGTYQISEGPEICDLLGPAHPATRAALERVLAEEARLDLDRLVREALGAAKEQSLISPQAP